MKAGWIAACLALSCIAGQAQAASSQIGFVCVAFESQKKALAVTVRSVCLGSGKRTLSNSLALEVDQSTATIRLTGDFQAEYGFRIGSADCMGSTAFTFREAGIEARRYSVMLADRFLGTADFVEASDREWCSDGKGQKRTVRIVKARDFAEWSSDMVPDWRAWRGGSLPALLAPLLGNFPDVMEGRPAFTLSAEKALWSTGIVNKRYPYPRQLDEIMAVEIEQQGLADDSVMAMRYFGIARQGAAGWYLEQLFAQAMCARGPRTGQWGGTICP